MTVTVGIVFSMDATALYENEGLKNIEVLENLSVEDFATDAEAGSFCQGIDDACGYGECSVKVVRPGTKIAKVCFGQEDVRAAKYSDVVLNSSAERKAYEKGVMMAEGWMQYVQIEDSDILNYRNALAQASASGLEATADHIYPHIRSRDDLDFESVTSNEGWDLFEVYGSDLMEIQRDDEMGIFETDDDALAHVQMKADEGSAAHRNALARHMLDAPQIAQYRDDEDRD